VCFEIGQDYIIQNFPSYLIRYYIMQTAKYPPSNCTLSLSNLDLMQPVVALLPSLCPCTILRMHDMCSCDNSKHWGLFCIHQCVQHKINSCMFTIKPSNVQWFDSWFLLSKPKAEFSQAEKCLHSYHVHWRCFIIHLYAINYDFRTVYMPSRETFSDDPTLTASSWKRRRSI
jgi:hypothetical protein